MYIHEAITATRKVSSDVHVLPYIRRKSWPYSRVNDSLHTSVRLYPTNGPDRCIIISETDTGTRAGWQPTMDDLLADDWETCL